MIRSLVRATKEFLCVTTAEGGFGFVFEGTAGSNRIKAGNVVGEEGFSFAYECVPDVACSTFTSTSSGSLYKR